jgi:catechol 2,3-dioxygenase
MTETTYLEDPEGNGIELYVDTPEDGSFTFANGEFVVRDADGNLRSGRDPLDLEVLFEHLPASEPLDLPLREEIHIGHVHLHVADLGESVDFYHRVLGFDVMGHSPAMRAAFLSAGGYHHHVGLNTWVGEGAPPPPDATGLRHFSVVLPAHEDLIRIGRRLTELQWPAEHSAGGILVRDPSHNGALLTARPGRARDA